MNEYFQSKRILVLGGTGHLGSALIHHLVQTENVPTAQIRVFYLPDSPTASLRDLTGLDMVPGNILQPDRVQAAFRDAQLVFHMIGNTSFDPRIKALQWRINVEGTHNVLEACRRSPSVERLCYTGTVNALGVPNPPGSIGDFADSNPYTNFPRLHSFGSPEEVLAFADSIRSGDLAIKDAVKRIGIGYFDSKLAAQEIVDREVRESGLNIVSVLPGTMFGPHDYLIGNGMYLLALFHNRMPGVLPGGLPLAHVMDVVEGHLLVMHKADKGQRYIITGAAEDNRYLKDMAGIIVDVLEEAFPGRRFNRPSKVFHPGIAKGGARAMEFISRLRGKPNPLSVAAVRGGSVPSFYSYAKAQTDLGYFPKRTFQQAVREMLQYYLAENLMETKARFLDTNIRAQIKQ
jgi:dihydroflavonol-4-reductase